MNAISLPCAPPEADDHRQQHFAALLSRSHRPRAGLAELRHADAPPVVQAWAAASPAWLKIHPDPVPRDKSLADLDPGERTAILLAEQLRAAVVLLDEAAARALATQRGLKVAGTLGVLRDAAQAGLLKLPDALDQLRKTNFRASQELWKSLYSRRDRE